MAWRPHGRAKVDARSPRAFGVCDRCSFWYNLEKLTWQYQWAGSTLQNLRLLVCDTCLDVPQQQLRSIILPADPQPIFNARPQNFDQANNDYRVTQTDDLRITQADEPRVVQETGDDLEIPRLMANVQIPDLPAAIGVDGNEELEMVQGGISVRGTSNQIAGLAHGSVTLPQTANKVFAGPTVAPAAIPTFRSLVTADFPASGVTAATYGDATHIPSVTVDATGRVTAASNIVATGTVSSVGLAMPSEFAVANSPITTSGTLTVTWNAPVTVPHGGTGFASYTIGDLLYADTANTLAKLADIATGNALLSGGVGVAPLWGKVNLTTTITGILPVANGGTGIASGTSGGILGYTATGTLASSVLLTANAIVLGGGAGATPTPLGSLGTTTTVLHGNAAGAPTYGAIVLTTDVSGTLPAANGGTGNNTYAIGDILFASASTTLSKLADVATGNALISGGVTTAPLWGKIGLTTHVSGTLPIANGGTNATTQIGAWDSLSAQGSVVASAGTTNLTTATGPVVDISGTTTITTVTLASGSTRMARATGGFAFTASATLVVNGATTGTYTASVGEAFLFEGYAASTVYVWSLNSVGSTGGYAPANQATTDQCRNAIINGDFSVGQRGLVFTTPASNAYTLDRWFVFYDGSIGTFTVQQVFQGLGSPTGRERKYYIQWNQTVAGSGSTARQIVQRIPNVLTFAGQQITFSFYASADSARTVAASATQLFGSGGSPSGQVQTGLGSFALTATPTRFSFTVVIPSLSGKTLGSNGDDSLQIAFTLPLNVTMTINIWDVQLELGSNASEFARQPFATTLQQCLPFYCKSFFYAQAPQQNVGASSGSLVFPACVVGATATTSSTVRFPTQMNKTAPTVTLYNPLAANAQARNLSLSTDSTAATVANLGPFSFNVTCTCPASTTAGQAMSINWSAEAEL